MVIERERNVSKANKNIMAIWQYYNQYCQRKVEIGPFAGEE